MVNNITSLTGNGLKDWLIQRVTALFFAVYAVYVLGFLIAHPGLDFTQWRELFQCRVFQVATLLALISVSLHAWIGIWTVTTDYMKCTAIRLSVQLSVVLWLLSQLIWGIMIVWGQ